jgi:hypothetical protein
MYIALWPRLHAGRTCGRNCDSTDNAIAANVVADIALPTKSRNNESGNSFHFL